MHLLLLFPLLFRLSGSSGVIMGPEEARGPERGSLTVQCRYVPRWEKHVKYWCRGSDFSICRILVRTAGSEQEVKKDRVSIRDNQTSRVFTVTMEKLRREDADTYWCVIERVGSDHGAPVKVTVGPRKRVCVCGCVASGPALSWSLEVPFRDCAHSEGTVPEGG
ncbi:CMRF35-like molecule 1 [Phyllostomus discolor]|uniref:CMRF35-like molecule 1 n=1 Tax=Phyllostomus discolor TaxID=89673 RepID=A0A7E6EG82_9CHIR|nr:CMRF35-like molecule 1 [Phyllostomus discolor]